jgi:hypothetical protein
MSADAILARILRRFDREEYVLFEQLEQGRNRLVLDGTLFDLTPDEADAIARLLADTDSGRPE